MQIAPSTYLSPIIKHYLFLNYTPTQWKKVKLRYFANGHTCLVIPLKEESLPLSMGNGNSFFLGQTLDKRDFDFLGNLSIAVIVFQPSGLYQLMGIPITDIPSHPIPSTEIFGKSVQILFQKLLTFESIHEQVELLNAYFQKQVSKKRFIPKATFNACFQSILLSKGQLKTSQLTKKHQISERTLQRDFNKYVGISVRDYSKIVRFHHFLGQVAEKQNNPNLTQVGLLSGYYDQSHSIREFRRFTELTPKEYLRNKNRLAINLINIEQTMSELYNSKS